MALTNSWYHYWIQNNYNFDTKNYIHRKHEILMERSLSLIQLGNYQEAEWILEHVQYVHLVWRLYYIKALLSFKANKNILQAWHYLQKRLDSKKRYDEMKHPSNYKVVQ